MGEFTGPVRVCFERGIFFCVFFETGCGRFSGGRGIDSKLRCRINDNTFVLCTKCIGM